MNEIPEQDLELHQDNLAQAKPLPSMKLEVLIVEDSKTQAIEVKHLLEEAGFHVRLAENGRDALEQLSREKPHLVISDVVMPGMNGYELCRAIRADENLKDIPVILLTSLSQPEDIFSGLDCGADNFVAKPFDAQYLIRRIHFLVLNSELRDRDQMNFGIEVLFGGKRHFVSANRVQILHHLLSTYETTMAKTRELEKAQRQLKELNNELEAKVAERTAALQAEVEERKRAQAELAHRLRLEESLASISSHFIDIEPEGMDAAIQASLQEIGEAMNVDSSFIWLLGAGETVFTQKNVWCRPGLSPHCPKGDSVRVSECGWWLERLKNKAIISVDDTALLPPEGAAFERLSGFKSVLVIPIYGGEEHLIGTLGLATVEKREGWLAPNISLVKVAVEVFAKAIQHGRGQQVIREQANLLDLATDAIIARDMDGRVLFWNSGAERLYGWKREEVLGKMATSEIYQDPSEYSAARVELLRRGEWQAEVTQRNREGKELIVSKQWTLVKDEDGNPTSVLSIGSNVTGRKILEKQFYQAQKQESLGSLASGIAHDFNNLLAIMSGYTELIAERTSGDPEVEKLSREVLGAGRRAGLLVRQILTFARQTESNLQPIEINRLVEEIVTVAQATFPRRIAIKAALAKRLPSLAGDPTQIYQVLMNLLVNARDAIDSEGEIEIRTFSSTSDTGSDCIGIQVVDTGKGIPADIRERIFDPFFTTKPKGEGTGLGLSVVDGIVKSHGGTFDVSSEVGRGTTFTLRWPACEQKEAGGVDAKGRMARPAQRQAILVVEDERAIREMIALVLNHSGYQVTKACDGREALTILEGGERFEVILADHDMPGLSGAELFKEVSRRGTPGEFILLSGYVAPEVLKRLKREGLKWHLDKPLAVHEILLAVSRALEPQL